MVRGGGCGCVGLVEVTLIKMIGHNPKLTGEREKESSGAEFREVIDLLIL